MSNDAFSGRLLKGEQVLWSGRPGKGLMLAKADVFITLVLLSTGLSFVCDGVEVSRGAALFTWLQNVVGILYGLFLIASPFFFYFYAHPFQNPLYAVTSSRILLLAGRTHNSFVALPLDHEFVFSLTKGRKGRGTIFFGPDVRKYSDKPLFFPKSSFRIYFDPRKKFFSIEDARDVFSLIQSAVEAA